MLPCNHIWTSSPSQNPNEPNKAETNSKEYDSLGIWGSLISIFLGYFFHAPAPEHSADNNLLFFFVSADSPLKSYSVALTAGVIPKRFHSHNDCKPLVTVHELPMR